MCSVTWCVGTIWGNEGKVKLCDDAKWGDAWVCVVKNKKESEKGNAKRRGEPKEKQTSVSVGFMQRSLSLLLFFGLLYVLRPSRFLRKNE